MRTPEVEAEHIEAMAAITAASRAAGRERTRAEAAEARVSWLEQQREEECKQKLAALNESEVCLKETREFKARAFKAEARVKELEADIVGMEAFEKSENALLNAAVAERDTLREQNARLRAALFKLRAAAHHAEIWLTSCLDCKDWMWSEHQHEAATEARDGLQAALNNEEAST